MFINKETWQSAINFDGLYEISSRGRVRRVKNTKNGITYKLINKRLLGGLYVFRIFESGVYVRKTFESLKYNKVNEF